MSKQEVPLTVVQRPPRPHEIMVEEQKGVGFEARELARVLYGGEERVKLIELLYLHLLHEEDFLYYHKFWKSYAELYEQGLSIARISQGVRRRLKLGERDYAELLRVADAFHRFPLAEAQENQFLPTLEYFANEEQATKWVPLAREYRILGCVGQIEIGHDVNLKAMETTATYVKDGDFFEINTPTLTSSKCWIDAAGKTATHAIIFARTFVDKNEVGIHPFLVQLRSLDDHTLLDGILTGHLGPRMGQNSNDSGFIRFIKHCIPRTNMLMRFAQVTADGAFVPPKSPRLASLPVLASRTSLIATAAEQLARGAVMANRFNIIRVQGGAGERETQLIDYPAVRYALFPALAASFGLRFTGTYLAGMTKMVNGAIAKGDESMVDEVDAVTAGIKAFSSEFVANTLETCRRACGQFGYSVFSYMPEMVATASRLIDMGGHNGALAEQNARFLVRALAAARAGKPISRTAAYFAKADQIVAAAGKLDQADAFVTLLQARVIALATALEPKIKADADIALDAKRLSDAHSMYMVVLCFNAEVAKLRKDGANAEVVKSLADLANILAIYFVETATADLLELQLIKPAQAAEIRSRLQDAFAPIRKNLKALADGWWFADNHLSTHLGRKDGMAYHQMFLPIINTEPYNKVKVAANAYEIVKPLIKNEMAPYIKAAGMTSSL